MALQCAGKLLNLRAANASSGVVDSRAWATAAELSCLRNARNSWNSGNSSRKPMSMRVGFRANTSGPRLDTLKNPSRVWSIKPGKQLLALIRGQAELSGSMTV